MSRERLESHHASQATNLIGPSVFLRLWGYGAMIAHLKAPTCPKVHNSQQNHIVAMSSDTHLCNRCLSIFSRGTDLHNDLGPQQCISSGPHGESGRQWPDKKTGGSWIEACGMFHERGWDAHDVSKAALVRSAEEGCYICVSIWRRYSTFTNKGIRYRPGVEKISYEVEEGDETSFSLEVTVYGAQESCVGLLCGKPRTSFFFRGVLHNGR